MQVKPAKWVRHKIKRYLNFRRRVEKWKIIGFWGFVSERQVQYSRDMERRNFDRIQWVMNSAWMIILIYRQNYSVFLSFSIQSLIEHFVNCSDPLVPLQDKQDLLLGLVIFIRVFIGNKTFFFLFFLLLLNFYYSNLSAPFLPILYALLGDMAILDFVFGDWRRLLLGWQISKLHICQVGLVCMCDFYVFIGGLFVCRQLLFNRVRIFGRIGSPHALAHSKRIKFE